MGGEGAGSGPINSTQCQAKPTYGMARLNISDQIKFDELLIEEIKSYTFLFSTKDPRHRDPELKKTTYMKIAQSLNSGKPFHNFVS